MLTSPSVSRKSKRDMARHIPSREKPPLSPAPTHPLLRPRKGSHALYLLFV